MNIRTFFCALFCLLLLSCSNRKMYSESHPGLQIIRFDNYLYRYLTQPGDREIPDSCSKAFFPVYGEKILRIGHPDSPGFQDRLRTFFAEPALDALYRDEQTKFADISEINAELSQGMERLFSHFPQLKPPAVYLHVSGLNQNVIVTDEILSLSADKYLGADYPLYQDFFYAYQRQQMSPDRMVPDYLLGFLMANLPFEGNEDVLLDRMLYEGKLRYLLSQFLPDRNAWEWVAYNEEQYTWCLTHQSRIWKTVLENQHLFRSDYVTASQYLKEAPHTASLPVESPGRVGIWLGYRIVASYMKNHPGTGLPELMRLTDYRELLKLSKYHPDKSR